MNILFIYKHLNYGGVETLIVRLSSWLVSQGHSVTILLRNRGELDGDLDEKVKRIYVGDSIWTLFPGVLGRIVSTKYSKAPSVVCSFDPLSLWDNVLISKSFAPSTKILHGVFHPRIYFFNGKESLLEVILGKIFSEVLAENSILFMNNAVKAAHANHFPAEFKKAVVVPLPILDFGISDGDRKKYSIVSIGRLTAFKTYNLYMIDIVNSLVEQGFDVTWDVYGTGEYELNMRKKISESGLHDRIKLHGKLRYENFHDVLSSAFVFVGMGTSLIEAGLFGVPSIVAVDREGPVTYGYLHQLPDYAVGEVLEHAPKLGVSDMLIKLFALTDLEYQEECIRTRSHCERFIMEKIGPDYLEAFKGAGPIRPLQKVDGKYLYIYYARSALMLLQAFPTLLGIYFVKKTFPNSLEIRARTWYSRIKHRKSLRQQKLREG